jgi:hypothetical protein
MQEIKLLASDFSYLWEQCPRCYWLKTKKNIKRPSLPLPYMFGTVVNQMREVFADTVLSDINPEWPNAKIVGKDHFVKSKFINFEEKNMALWISSKISAIIEYQEENQNGRYGIIDFKISEPVNMLNLLVRQIHGVAYAFENPARIDQNYNGLIRSLGLFIFDPNDGFNINNLDKTAFIGSLKYKNVIYTPNNFIKYMGKVADLLYKEDEPEYTKDTETSKMCEWCERDMQIRENK